MYVMYITRTIIQYTMPKKMYSNWTQISRMLQVPGCLYGVYYSQHSICSAIHRIKCSPCSLLPIYRNVTRNDNFFHNVSRCSIDTHKSYAKQDSNKIPSLLLLLGENKCNSIGLWQNHSDITIVVGHVQFN